MEQKRQDMKEHASRIGTYALVIFLAACTGSTPPSPTTNPTTTGSSTSTTTTATALYFVADTAQGLRLYREFHRVNASDSPIKSAINALFTTDPSDPDYTNLWPSNSKVISVTIDNQTATIDLSFTSLNVGSEAELRAIDQIVWTATAAMPSVRKIALTRDGKKVESFAGHVDTRGTFTREPTYEVLAPVWITSTEEGARLTRPLTFGGLAQTFEANVEWEVRQGAVVIARGATTAGEAAPARTPWKVTLPKIPSGSYTIRAFTSSAKDGSLVAEDTKQITLR